MRVYRHHIHAPGIPLGAICRCSETLELARCGVCGQVVVRPEPARIQAPTKACAWLTMAEYVSRRHPRTPGSLI